MEESYEVKSENVKVKRHLVLKTIVLVILMAIASFLLFLVYQMETAKNEYYIGEKNLQIPILVYHDLVQDKSEVKEDYMQTPVDVFENQIVDLMAMGYKPISYQDLIEYKEGKKKISKFSFLITFDDGYEGVYKLAYPLAEKYKIPMTSFIIDSEAGKEGYYSWNQARQMNESKYMKVYSHGLEHIKYDAESTEKLVADTKKAYENIISKFRDNNVLKIFTYPYGLYTEEQITALANEGFVQNLTDNRVNESKNLNLNKLHRCYPLEDSAFKIVSKIQFRLLKYGSK